MRLALHKGPMPAELAAQLPADEAAACAELAERGDMTLTVTEEDGQLAGYAVFGMDQGDLLAVYKARAIRGFVTRAAMMGLFGAAQIAGTALRVHTDKVEAMARMMGAKVSFRARDGDGLPMGVFCGQ